MEIIIGAAIGVVLGSLTGIALGRGLDEIMEWHWRRVYRRIDRRVWGPKGPR